MQPCCSVRWGVKHWVPFDLPVPRAISLCAADQLSSRRRTALEEDERGEDEPVGVQPSARSRRGQGATAPVKSEPTLILAGLLAQRGLSFPKRLQRTAL